ncbi:zinc dependent phospholipase C family protein [Oceanobacillus halotolerans]|uniref:zinc dependent phospholipase C family protein n=1 Tax=Oceanobacillus halotolerans TaxID=2663380 RepID=UPI0013D8E4DE|nr:zinc dependent phospholipase C family protein [Oceanobacillus halotolerans]
MPNIWTHMLFCEEVVDSIGHSYPFSQDEAYMKLGAQGPDPFFYYNFWPWVKDEPIHEIGKLLHTKHCGAFLIDLIEEAKSANSRVKAYVFGFVTHHILDRQTHPYIHFRAGYEGNNHQRLEVRIDTKMMHKFYNLNTWKVPVYKEIDVGSNLQEELAMMLHKTIAKHYPEINRPSPAYIQKAYRDMKRALKILADPYGWKNALFGSLIGAFSHQPIKDDIDDLNENHTTWYHSATNKPSNNSFIELYDQARVEGSVLLRELIKFWENGSEVSKQRLVELIGDISYDTGEPLALELENQYADPII